MKSLRIAFFGSGLVSACQTESAGYFRGIIRALGNRGDDVTFYEPDVSSCQRHWDLQDPLWSKILVYSPRQSELWRALEAAGTADVLIKIGNIGIFDELLEAAVPQVRSPHTTVAFWDADPSVTLDRVANNANDPFRSLIPQYDIILMCGGTQREVQRYLRFGARACLPICNALDPYTHHPALPDPRFSGDLGLLANSSERVENELDPLFFKAAERGREFRFVLGGTGWLGRTFARNIKCVGHVFARDRNAFNSSTMAMLNVNSQDSPKTGVVSPRIFEAAGTAACLISEPSAGVESFLEPHREVLIARHAGELVEHLRHLSPARAREIGKAARKRILAEHTYDNRVQQLENVLGLGAKNAPAAACTLVRAAASGRI